MLAAALGRVLAAHYAAGAPDALKVALSGENPSDVARKLYYLAELSRATAQLLRELREGLADPKLPEARKVGDAAWSTGMALWYDPRTAECRGSLVGLVPG